MPVLQGFDRVFGGEPPHQQRKLGVGCHVDRGINSLNVLGGAPTSVQFYNEFDAFHFLRPLRETVKAAIHLFEVAYTAESGLPHSRQHNFDLEVISPQFAHIICDRYPAICGIGLRIHWTSRIMKTMIFRLKETLVVFTKTTLLGRILHQ